MEVQKNKNELREPLTIALCGERGPGIYTKPFELLTDFFFFCTARLTEIAAFRGTDPSLDASLTLPISCSSRAEHLRDSI